MNTNSIRTDGWSNPRSESIYKNNWPSSPELQLQHENGDQCGGCSFFAPFNADWGLCCNSKASHHMETVFEHFTCADYVREGWGPHSFTVDTSFHCRCGGESSEYWDKTIAILQSCEKKNADEQCDEPKSR